MHFILYVLGILLDFVFNCCICYLLIHLGTFFVYGIKILLDKFFDVCKEKLVEPMHFSPFVKKEKKSCKVLVCILSICTKTYIFERLHYFLKRCISLSCNGNVHP